MKRLTVKQVKLVKSLFTQLNRMADHDLEAIAALKLLEKLVDIEISGTELPVYQDWSERVTQEIRKAGAK